jgi:hypothetical protein
VRSRRGAIDAHANVVGPSVSPSSFPAPLTSLATADRFYVTNRPHPHMVSASVPSTTAILTTISKYEIGVH